MSSAELKLQIHCVVIWDGFRVCVIMGQCCSVSAEATTPHPLLSLFADIRDVFHGQLDRDLVDRVIPTQHWEYDPGS